MAALFAFILLVTLLRFVFASRLERAKKLQEQKEKELLEKQQNQQQEETVAGKEQTPVEGNHLKSNSGGQGELGFSPLSGIWVCSVLFFF